MIRSGHLPVTRGKGKTLDSKSNSLRERTEKATTDHIRKELAPVLAAVRQNQTEIQSCIQQISRLLHIQHEPWRKAGAMLWGIVMGALLFALLQPGITHTNHACTLGNRIMEAWPSLSGAERTLIEKISRE